MEDAATNEQTYPSFLLKNPCEATKFQLDLMVGISQAEARGAEGVKAVLKRLLQASVERHGSRYEGVTREQPLHS